MAEASGENRLEAEIDLNTAKAFQAVTFLIEALSDAQTETDAWGNKLDSVRDKLDAVASSATKLAKASERTAAAQKDSGESVEKATNKAAEAVKGLATEENKAAGAAERVKDAVTGTGEAAEKSATSHKKAGEAGKRGAKETADQMSALGEVQDRISNQISGIVTGYLGIQTVFKVLETLESRWNAVADAQDRAVDVALRRGKQAQDLVLNLGLTGPDAQNRALAIEERFVRAAPGATAEQIAGVVGAGGAATSAATGKSMTPEVQADFDLMAQIIRTAAPLQLNRQTSADLVKLMQSTGNLTPDKSKQFLSQLVTAQRTTPVENPQEFFEAFIRSSVPLTTQGVSLPEAAGLFAGSAAADPSALKAATNVERFTRLFSGSGAEKSQAFLYQQAQQAGLLGKDQQKAFAELNTHAIESMKPRDRLTYQTLAKDLSDTEADAKMESDKFTRELADAEKDRKELIDAGKDTRNVSVRIANLKDSHTRSVREFVDKTKHTRSEMQIMLGEQGEKDSAKLLMQMTMPQRMKLFMSLAGQFKSDQERAAFFTQAGASMEEAQAGIRMFAPGAITQRSQTQQAVAGAAPTVAGAAAADFAGSEMAKASSAAELRELTTAQGVTSGEFEANRFFQDTKVTADTQRRSEGGAGAFTIKWQTFWDNGDASASTITNDQYNLAVEIREAFSKSRKWWDGLDPRIRAELDHDGKGYELNKSWEKTYGSGSLFFSWSPLTRSKVRQYVNMIGNLAAWAETRTRQLREQDVRSKNAQQPGTGKKVSLFGGGAGKASGADQAAGVAAMAAAGDAGAAAMVTDVMPAAGGASTPGASVATAGGGGVHYNVSIGMLVSQGGDSLDLPGPLNGQV
jgi:hypothetical protein